MDPNDKGRRFTSFGFTAIEYASVRRYDLVKIFLRDYRVNPVDFIKNAAEIVASQLIQEQEYGYKKYKKKYDKHQQEIVTWYERKCSKRKQRLNVLKWTLRKVGLKDMYYDLKKIIKIRKFCL